MCYGQHEGFILKSGNISYFLKAVSGYDTYHDTWVMSKHGCNAVSMEIYCFLDFVLWVHTNVLKTSQLILFKWNRKIKSITTDCLYTHLNAQDMSTQINANAVQQARCCDSLSG